MEDFKQYLGFLWAMTEKEIKTRYKKSVFGFLWIILNPLLLMLIIGVIFSLFIKIPNYFLFLLSGLLPWSFFSLTLNRTTVSIVNERALLQKAKFPIEVIPISILLSDFFNLLISLFLLITFILFTHTLVFPNILFLVPSLVWLLAITLGVSLLTSALYVQFRDVGFLVKTLLTLGFYTTPVIFSLSFVPEEIRLLFSLNPLTSIIELFHFSLLNQGIIYNSILIVNLVITAGLMFMGVFVYFRKRKYFADWI